MATLDLIDKAESDKSAAATAEDAVAAAAQTKLDADSAAAASAKALFDDLTANGPAVTVAADPTVVTLYTAAPPDLYTATILRVAS